MAPCIQNISTYIIMYRYQNPFFIILYRYMGKMAKIIQMMFWHIFLIFFYSIPIQNVR